MFHVWASTVTLFWWCLWRLRSYMSVQGRNMASVNDRQRWQKGCIHFTQDSFCLIECITAGMENLAVICAVSLHVQEMLILTLFTGLVCWQCIQNNFLGIKSVLHTNHLYHALCCHLSWLINLAVDLSIVESVCPSHNIYTFWLCHHGQSSKHVDNRVYKGLTRSLLTEKCVLW